MDSNGAKKLFHNIVSKKILQISKSQAFLHEKVTSNIILVNLFVDILG
jgi:hypothetical protein